MQWSALHCIALHCTARHNPMVSPNNIYTKGAACKALLEPNDGRQDKMTDNNRDSIVCSWAILRLTIKIEYLFTMRVYSKWCGLIYTWEVVVSKAWTLRCLEQHTAESHSFANGMHVPVKRSSKYARAAVNRGRRVACLIKQHKN